MTKDKWHIYCTVCHKPMIKAGKDTSKQERQLYRCENRSCKRWRVKTARHD